MEDLTETVATITRSRLMDACYQGDWTTGLSLVASGADVNCISTFDGTTALHSLCMRENKEGEYGDEDNCAKELHLACSIVTGSNVLNHRDQNGWAPLHHVAYTATPDGRGDLTQLLLSSGADLDLTTTSTPRFCLGMFPVGVTPLHIACANGSRKIASLLLQNGCSVNISDTHGWQCVHYVLYYSREPEILKLLIKHGVELDKPVSVRNVLNVNILGLAVLPSRRPVCDVMLSDILDHLPVCKVTQRDSEGRSPLHITIENGDVAATQFILTRHPGLLISMETESDNTGLLPVQKAPLRTLFYLIENGSYLPTDGFVGARSFLMNKLIDGVFLMYVAMVTAGNYHVIPKMTKYFSLQSIYRQLTLPSLVEMMSELDPLVAYQWNKIVNQTPERQTATRTCTHMFPKLNHLCHKVIKVTMFECGGRRSVIPMLRYLPLPRMLLDGLGLDKVKELADIHNFRWYLVTSRDI